MSRKASNFSIAWPFAVALAIHAGLVLASLKLADYSPSGSGARMARVEAPADVSVMPLPLVRPPELQEFRVGAEDGAGRSLQDVQADRLNAAKLAEAEQPLTRVEPKMPSSSADSQAEAGATVQQLAGTSRSMFDRVPMARMPGEVIEPDEESQPGAPVEATQKPGELQKPEQAARRASDALDPAMFANNDMDAFSMDAGVTMQPGKTEVRAGRPIDKLRQPRIDLAFQADARAIGGTIGVVYTIAIDDNGKPREVTVKQSSGSITIDEAWRRALLETTFGGKRPDTFAFGVAIVVD